MKTVYIATDSRGSHAAVARGERSSSWTGQFMQKYPANYILRRSAMEIDTYFIYDTYCLEQYEDGSIDLAILQMGMNTGIDYWSSGAFKILFGKHYTPDGLIHHQGSRDRYIYSHKPSEEAVFALIRRKCKRVVFIGLHTMSRWHLEYRGNYPSLGGISAAQMLADPVAFQKSLTTEWNPCYNVLAESQNRWYGSLVNDYVPLPWDENWVDECCFSDYLHYNGKGIEYIISKLHPIATSVIESNS